MSGTDFDAERAVDLARWRRAVVALWWLPVAGLVLGAIVGAVLSVGSGSTYQASVLLSLGQPFSPSGGAPVNGLINNPRTVDEIIRSESAIDRASARSGLSPGQLRGHVTSSTILPAQARANAQPLVTVKVTGSRPVRVERAANTLVGIVIDRISGDYVTQKISSFNSQLERLNVQVASVNRRIKALNESLSAAKKNGLSPIDQLVLVNLLDSSVARLGGLIQAQSLAQQQLALAKNVESPRIVQPAAAVKSTIRSRRDSILVGALIGLLLGVAAAIVVDARRTPA
jgi:hypothetical protein